MEEYTLQEGAEIKLYITDFVNDGNGTLLGSERLNLASLEKNSKSSSISNNTNKVRSELNQNQP